MMKASLARLHNQVALVEEGHAGWLEACMSQVDVKQDDISALEASLGNEFWDEGWGSLRPYNVQDGVLKIPVKGVLLNDFPYAFGSWATGYEYIWEAVKRGVADSNVKGIALVINSGGGMVSGNWDLVDRIYGARASKPIHAFAAEHAYSAAYNIAAAAEHLTVARTGGVGSIGVIITQFEYSKALEQSGITVNLIRSKNDKMEGNPYETLSDAARSRMQSRVNESHEQFVAMVARNRGLSVEAVDGTDAHTFSATEAVALGLADEIGALDDAVTAFAASFNEGDELMADQTKAGITEEAHVAAVGTAKADGVQAGVTQERARITSILGSEEATARPTAALMMVNLGISAEQAAVELAKLPKETPVAAAPAAAAPAEGAGVPSAMFNAAMNGTQNPNITTEGDGQGAGEVDKASHLRNLAASAGLKGYGKANA